MKEKVYFYATKENGLITVPKNSKVFSGLTDCSLKIGYDICSEEGIHPTSGYIYTPEDGYIEYKLIERYPNQFELLKTNVNIYLISAKENKIDDNFRLVNDGISFRNIKIDNLFEYLKSIKNIELINNDNNEKYFYDIPYDNGDIIQECFKKSLLEKNLKQRKKYLSNIKKLLIENRKIVNKLYKLTSSMSLEEASEFINNIYNKNDSMLNYDLIREKEKKQKKCMIKCLLDTRFHS